MPAKKIIDAVGSTCDVMGSSMATVTAGPRPGSTPMPVPMTQPRKAHSRLTGVPAVAKPPSSWFHRSIMAGPPSQPAAGRQARQVDGQQLAEHPEHRRGDGHTGEQVDDAALGAAATALPSAMRRPRTASAKHRPQDRMKPMVVMRLALATTPATTQATARQSPRSAPDGLLHLAVAAAAGLPHQPAPQTISTTDTSQGRALGPTPA